LAALATEEIRAPFNFGAPGGARGGRAGQAAQPAGGRGGQQALARRINEFYIAEGVVATVEPGRGDGGTVFVSAGGDRAKDAPAVPSQIVVAVEHYNRMVRILEKDIPVNLEIDFQAEYTNPDGFEYNVVGEIPGTDKKDELVMVGGHFDSWHTGTGATDNAAGSATAMEVMRIIKQSGLKPRRTIRIGLWSGEEEGLLGSRAYVNDTFASRPAPAGGPGGGGGGGGRGGNQVPPTPHEPAYSKFAGYFNIDNGTGKIRGIYLQGNEEVRPIFEAWLAPFKDLGATTITVRNTGGTDHQSFDGVGLPGFQFIQDEVEYSSRTHHSNQDVYDRIQRADMVQISVIEAAFVYNAAMREQKLPRKPMPAPAPTTGGGSR
jgi:carboxypeptidase Q